MNNDYLWDRTGEPDPEIQQLEEVLGTLRYQPQPLELPAGVRPERRRRFFPPLAIAAAIALMVLAAGLWVRFHRLQTTTHGEVASQPSGSPEKKNSRPAAIASAPRTDSQPLANNHDKGSDHETARNSAHKPSVPKHSFASNANRHPAGAVTPAGLTAEQRNQALAAKEQLLLALRVASAKLSFAQRKTQGPPAPSTIRNQHKNG